MRLLMTGIGIVSPLAVGARATMRRLAAGERAFGPVSLFDTTGLRSGICAEVPGLRVADIAPAGAAARWSRTDAMAVVAAREALAEARLEPSSRATALAVGGTTAGMLETEALLAELLRDSGARRPLEQMLSHPLSATADRLATVAGPFCHARSVCSACSSGANALIIAAAWLRAGRCERVLVGAADGLCRLTYTGFSALGALSPTPCRPFDRARDGLSLGEGAAFVVVETEDSANERGARPIAELRGWAVGAEAHHITNPEPTGKTAARVIGAALTRAGVSRSDVGYVNAHGTATRLNDAMEASALRQVFGVAGPAVSSSKGQIGHTLGAAGAIEAAITALSLDLGVLPPTAGLSDVDPECELRHVRTGTQERVHVALSSSFGFGGSDTVVVLTAPGALPAPAIAAGPRRVFVLGAASVGPLGVLGTSGAQGYLDGESVRDGAGGVTEKLTLDPAGALDRARVRRIDRPGRLCTAVVARALADAGHATFDSTLAPVVGAIVGSAFGSVDACASFVPRILEKGGRFASPAEFPNLVPSSPVAHASIYVGLGGMAVSCHDLGATALAAMVTAVDLVAAGELELAVGGSFEEASVIAGAVMSPAYAQLPAGGVRGEGAAVLLFGSAPITAAVAEVVTARSFRGAPCRALADLPPPLAPERALAVTGSWDLAAREALAGSPWRSVARLSSSSRVGCHEASAGLAAAAALATLANGAYDEALCLGLAPDRGYALVLRRKLATGARESP